MSDPSQSQPKPAAKAENQIFLAAKPSEKAYGGDDDESTSGGARDGAVDWVFLFAVARYVAVVVLVGLALAIPIIVANLRNNSLVFYAFCCLETIWLCGVATDLLALLFPYVFRLVARYVNPAHHRYWRVFRTMRLPVTMLGTIVAAYVAYATLLFNNEQLSIDLNLQPNTWTWKDTVYDILEQIIFWVVGYNLEKVGILYVSIHYHYRADQTRNTHSKQMHKALVTLYEASVYLHPVDGPAFAIEDAAIRGSRTIVTGGEPSYLTAGRFLGRLGFGKRGIARFFGSFDESSHWLNPHSSYGVVERALSHPKSASALATRIWRSLALSSNEVMTAEDVAEVLGPYRREEALECFKVLDENESKDIRHDEFVWTVVEAGRVRGAIYDSMAAVHHCINTVDWIALIALAVIMIFFILVLYVPAIKDIQNTISFLAIGLSFAAGRTIHKFLSGCIFVFFEHPFDIGDRVEIFNMNSTTSFSCFVTGQSILYTTFQRYDTNTIVQFPNDRLSLLRLENVTRSGPNKEARTISIHADTSFKDLMALRGEMEKFLKDKANSRDYMPALAWNVLNIPDLNRIDVRFAFTHKHNWSNEPLRARRSSRFVCALMAAARKLGIQSTGPRQGDELRPFYQVAVPLEEAGRLAAERARMTEEEGAGSTASEEAAALDKLTKVPAVEKKRLTKGDETDTSLLQGSTGMRTRNGAEGGIMHYR